MEISEKRRRLADYRLRKDPCDRFVRLPGRVELASRFQTAHGGTIELPLPLLWYDPLWHHSGIDRCRDVAVAFAQAGVIVSALHRELSQSDDGDESRFAPRLAAHRCDRTGFIARDFEDVTIIDLRLAVSPNRYGRIAYDSRRVARWRHVDPSQVNSECRGHDGMVFPPDWSSLDSMVAKVSQLRCLSTAAVFVSFDEDNANVILPAAIQSGCDGLIIVCNDDPVESILQARQQIALLDVERSVSLWVVSPAITEPLHCVICLALGANGVAIDRHCNDFFLNGLGAAAKDSQQVAARYGHAANNVSKDSINTAAKQIVDDWAESIRGLLHGCGVDGVQRLKSEHLSKVNG